MSKRAWIVLAVWFLASISLAVLAGMDGQVP